MAEDGDRDAPKAVRRSDSFLGVDREGLGAMLGRWLESVIFAIGATKLLLEGDRTNQRQ